MKHLCARSLWRLFLFFASYTVWAGPYLKIQQVDSSNYPRVEAEISVSNITPIEDLDESAFEVYENGWKAGYFNLLKVEQARDPKHIVLLVDASKSLSSEDFQTQIAGVKNFIKSLNKYDKVAMIAFHDESSIRCGYSNSRRQALECIDSIKQNGKNTVLHDALREAYNLAMTHPEARNYVILFTDGREEGSQTSESTLEKLFSKNEITLFVVGTGSQKKLKSLARLAHMTGGELYLTAGMESISKIYQLLNRILESTYSIRYLSQVSGNGIVNKTNRLEIRFNNGKLADQAYVDFSLPANGGLRRLFQDESMIFFVGGLGLVIFLLLILIILTVSRNHRRGASERKGSDTEQLENVPYKGSVPGRNPESYDPFSRESFASDAAQASAGSHVGSGQEEDFTPQPLKKRELISDIHYARAYFVEKEGPQTGKKHRIHWHSVTIGHGDENTIVLDDPTVSYSHARVDLRGGDFIIFDLLSEHGVYVNGKKILRPRELHDFDEIRLGRTLLLFRRAAGS